MALILLIAPDGEIHPFAAWFGLFKSVLHKSVETFNPRFGLSLVCMRLELRLLGWKEPGRSIHTYILTYIPFLAFNVDFFPISLCIVIVVRIQAHDLNRSIIADIADG